jgi:hypothetical protein
MRILYSLLYMLINYKRASANFVFNFYYILYNYKKIIFFNRLAYFYFSIYNKLGELSLILINKFII